MYCLTPSGDLLRFQLHGRTLHYELRLSGFEVEEILSFQVHLSPPQDIHLCLLDSGHSLTYYRFQRSRWQKLQTWAGVSPAYQSLLREGHEMHLCLRLEGKNRHYILTGEGPQDLEVPWDRPQWDPYRFFPLSEKELMLIHREIKEPSVNFFAQCFSLPDRRWQPAQFLASLPAGGRRLSSWRWRDWLYFAYFLTEGQSQALHLLGLNLRQGSRQEQRFSGFSLQAAAPVPALCREEPVLLVGEAGALVCLRSADGGRNWPTRLEVPCPWRLELAPVLNHRQEITPYVALEGAGGASFSQPAVLKADELLSLSSPRS